ncbi:tyrosine-type recombinase/integrase [Mangrovibacillus cuniculi]|uniref:Site-specific integrase n=1 Tax=Mangrovibacillus cuniculi TaxID=2593652 RepID=A0A7S8CDZ5_9BACI|nr:tyrosine-type recombinase/integrase [Mangrovibacillus cuniculi]QPC48211.1 site-specific integrase [Mangrovibacillus cuniculi]
MKGTYKRRGCTCEDERKCGCGKRWSYWLDIGRDPLTGKRKQLCRGGFQTKHDAEMAAASVMADLREGTYMEQSNILFKDFVELWIPLYVERKGPKPGTVRLKKYAIKKLLPYLAHLKIKDITEQRYQEALNHLQDSGLSKTTLEGIHSTGNMIFQMAVNKKYIKYNPTLESYIKKDVSSEKDIIDVRNTIPKYLEKDELKIFLDSANSDGLYMDSLIFTLLAYTGIRVGELVALKWNDVNMEKKTLTISKTYYNEKNNIAKYEILPPKTKKANRKLFVSSTVIRLLLQIKEEQDQLIQRLGKGYEDRGFIFTNVRTYPGLPILTTLVASRMKRVLKNCNLHPGMTPHTLRHTHTSLLAEANVELDDIRDRLGHEDDDITRKIYLHVTDPVNKEVSDKFDDLMNSF